MSDDINDIIEQQRQASSQEDGAIVERQASAVTFGRAEIDQQIATAHAFPRSVKTFMSEAASLVTITQEVAESCTYALPRRQKDRETGRYVTKNIVGPSARFAEIVGSCWGNARARTGLQEEGQDFVVARGVMMDLQKNWGIEVDVPRRIVDSQGRRFTVDMIGVTVAAASSIALRNAILKVVPRALWEPIWSKARATALGEGISLSEQRLKALEWFQKKGVSKETIFEHFSINGIEDMTLEHIESLLGYKTALKEGDTSVERIFGKDDVADTARKREGPTTSLKDIKDKASPPAASAAPSPAPATATNEAPKPPEPETLLEKFKKAKNQDALDVHWAWVTPANYPDEAIRIRLNEAAEARSKELDKGPNK